MSSKKLTDDQKRALVIKALRKLGVTTSTKVVEETGLDRETVAKIGKKLIREKKAKLSGANGKFLELIEKEEAPAKKKQAPAKKKAKDDDDWDDDDGEEDEDEDGDEESDDEDEDGEDEDGDEDSEDEDGDSEDEDEDEDEDGEEDEDDEDEDEAPAKKKKVTPKGKAQKESSKKAKKEEKAPKEFTLSFKPIDTLTDKELKKRIEVGLEAAESLADDGETEVAELIMRSLVRVRKQLKRRD